MSPSNVRRSARQDSQRRGFSLLEIFVAGTLLAALLSICLQIIKATTEQQRAIEHRQLAVQEAANLMERLCGRPWPQLTPEAVRQVQLREEMRQVLPGAELAIDVVQPAGEPAAKRISVQIRWQDKANRATRPVRLVAWKYRPKSSP